MIKIQKLVFISLFLLNPFFSRGQTSIGFKIYQNTDIFQTHYFEGTPVEKLKIENVNFSRFSLALDIVTKKGFTHEIEFLIPEMSKSLDDAQFPYDYELVKAKTVDSKISSYSLRYELSKLLTNKVKRFSFSLGAGINPYYVLVEYEPNVYASADRSEKAYGFSLNMTPRIEFRLNRRFSLDLNVPLKIYDFREEIYRIKSPSIPISQQTDNDYHSIFFESVYTIRLGLMYNFSK